MADVREEYANALFKLAEEENLTGTILEDVRSLNLIFKENPGYVRLLSAPTVRRDERRGLLDSVFAGRIHKYTMNFLKLMIDRGHFSSIEDCFDEYISLYNKANNIEVVTVFSPVKLTAAQKEKLKESLALKLSKNIELIEKTDKSLIGGIRLEMSGRLIDSSVKARLESIRTALNSTVL